MYNDNKRQMRTSVAMISRLRPAGLPVGRRREAGRDRHGGGEPVAGGGHRQHGGTGQSAVRQGTAISVTTSLVPFLPLQTQYCNLV